MDNYYVIGLYALIVCVVYPLLVCLFFYLGFRVGCKINYKIKTPELESGWIDPIQDKSKKYVAIVPGKSSNQEMV